MGEMAEAQKYHGVRQALRQDSPLWCVQHVDITCDGCETEPIVGHRFKCCTCEDIDLCSTCMRALVGARVKMSQEAPPLAAPTHQGSRPRKWVSKLHSRDLAAKWAALQTAVPCLHPSHKFQKVLDGPERAVVFTAGGSSGSSSGDSGPASSSGGSGEGRTTSNGYGGSSAAAAAAAAANGGGASASDDSGSTSSGLDQFLATFPPSASSCRDVAWIVVSHPDRGTQQQQGQQQEQQEQVVREQLSPQPPLPSVSDGHASASDVAPAAGSGGDRGGVEERVDAAVEEWEKLAAAAAASGRRPTAADVDALASKHGILKGKWMLFARSEAEADAAWATVARAVCGKPLPAGQAAAAAAAAVVQPAGQHQAAAGQAEQQGGAAQAGQGQQGTGGQQGAAGHQGPQAAAKASLCRPLCHSAKVSSSSPDGSWVICVYTANYQDGEDVQRVCRGLQAALPRGLLQDRRLLYKPDIYTYLGIYSRNEWQLKPTVREARLA